MSHAARRRAGQGAAAVVGIDAGKMKHALVVRPRGGEDSKPLAFPVTQAGFDKAVAFIQKATGEAPPGTVLVGIEFAGNCGFTLASYLDRLGYPVVSVMPFDSKRWKDVMHRSALKTDEKDAATIADLVYHGKYVAFPFLHPVHYELRQLMSAMDRLTLQRSQVVQRLRAVLHVAFPEFEKLFGEFSRKHTAIAVLERFPNPRALLVAGRAEVLEVLRSVSNGQFKEKKLESLFEAAESSMALPFEEGGAVVEIPILVQQIRSLNAHRETIEAQMVALLEKLPEAPFLLSVPGVGPLTAAVFLGAVGDVRAYRSAEQVFKLAGLNLVETSSGMKESRKRISKRGRASLRKHLYLLGMRHTVQASPYRAHYDALRARGVSYNSAVIVIARMIVRAMFAVARDRVLFDPMRSGAFARDRAGARTSQPDAA